MAALDPADLIASLQALTPDQLQAIKYMVAPDLKTTDILNHLQSLLNDVDAAAARGRAQIQGLIASVSVNTVIPTWLQVLTTMDGGKTDLSLAKIA